MAAKKATKKIVIKKKRWVALQATAPFEQFSIGETYVTDPQEKVGSKITIGLEALSGERTRQNTQLRFLISKFDNNTLLADLQGGFLLESTVKKLIRKSKEKSKKRKRVTKNAPK